MLMLQLCSRVLLYSISAMAETSTGYNRASLCTVSVLNIYTSRNGSLTVGHVSHQFCQLSCLLQFADVTCLMCSGKSTSTVGDLLNDEYVHYHQDSRMQFNIWKSSFMWFSTRSRNTTVSPVNIVTPYTTSINYCRKVLPTDTVY